MNQSFVKLHIRIHTYKTYKIKLDFEVVLTLGMYIIFLAASIPYEIVNDKDMM